MTATPPPSLENFGDGSEATTLRNLQGATASAVQKRLGAANLRRRDLGAEIWQYYGQGCVLDLFLYPPEQGTGEIKVSYLELRRRGESGTPRPADPRCLARVLAKKAP